jgi:hypothetical protein
MKKTIYAVRLEDIKKETAKYIQAGWEVRGLPYEATTKGFYQILVKKAK